MPYTLTEKQLEAILDSAVSLARSDRKLPRKWVVRVHELQGIGLKSGIVVLGTMALARATNPQIDPFALKPTAGNRAYNARQVAEFMQAHSEGRYDFASESKHPFNSTTVFGGEDRLDALTRLSRPKTAHVVDLLKDCARDLSKATAEEALGVLAAFVRVRMEVEKNKREAKRAIVRADMLSPDEIVGLAERFIQRWPETGRAGQALVGALLDCVFSNVDVGPIHSPRAGDIRVKVDTRIRLAGEVKQVAVSEQVALGLAESAARLGADTGLLVVFSRDHVPLDRDRIRSQALREHNVAIAICESVVELLSVVAAFSNRTLREIASAFPDLFAARLQQQGASDRAQTAWVRAISDRASSS